MWRKWQKAHPPPLLLPCAPSLLPILFPGLLLGRTPLLPPACLRHSPILLLVSFGSEGLLLPLGSGFLKADVSFPGLSQLQALSEERASSSPPPMT